MIVLMILNFKKFSLKESIIKFRFMETIKNLILGIYLSETIHSPHKRI
ncbi:hypothetical protein DFI02_102233 [Rhizobium sp. PP-F2F-G20b]|nr:hypothetical protein DFI02_102233 [Rhizobium sp. PP-F2F-G20b]